MKVSRRRISASGSERCRPAGRDAHRERTNLSHATDHHDRPIPGRWAGGCDRAHRRRAHAGQLLVSRVIVENVSGAGGTIGVAPRRTRGARWLHAEHRPVELARV